MNRILMRYCKKVSVLISLFLISQALLLVFPEAEAAIVFNGDTFFQLEQDEARIGAGQGGLNDTVLQFGDDSDIGDNGQLRWIIPGGGGEGEFILGTDDLSSNNRSNLSFELESVSSLPGGGAGLGAEGAGRVVILDTIDSVAPSCTLVPFCPAGTYVWDGGAWISLNGNATAANLTKVVTVDPDVGDNADYQTLATAATYLQNRSGGIILLSADTHVVSNNIDLTNVIIIGKDASRTTLQINGSGQLTTFDTSFESLTLDINGISSTFAIDVQAGSSALSFNFVDFDILDLGDSLIDSSSGVAPSVTLNFLKCNKSGGAGTILKAIGASNLNVASRIFIDSRSGDTPLEVSDWDVTLAGGGSVLTSGIITSVPAQSIFVSPGMNLQGAIDSLESVGNGGLITLLPGVHTVSSSITIESDDIKVEGYGDSSIIRTSGTFASTGNTIAAIQVGSPGSPVDGTTLNAFKLEVQDAIHGIRVTGGEDNRVDNVTVQKISGASGSGEITADIGILMIDGSATNLTRPVIINSRVFGDGVGSYFTDGVHVSSDGAISGVFGNGNRVKNALVEGNFVDYVGETAYVFVGADDSSLFNNRAARMGAAIGSTPYGIYMGGVTNANMTANVFTGSLTSTGVAIGIESFNTGSVKTTRDSLFTGNVIDGIADGGAGFATGFQIGNASNTAVLRNAFDNNSIQGPSAGATVAFDVRGNADENSFSNNNVFGTTNPWDVGISIVSALAQMNNISNNRETNVTTFLNDSGTATRRSVDQHQDTVNPGINDDSNDGYSIGSLWINTSNDTAYVLVDDTVGAADWQQINGGVSGGGGEKIEWLDIFGGVRSSASAGSVAGGNTPVLRFDASSNSRVRYSFPVPNDIDTAQAIQVDVFWSPAEAGNGVEQIEWLFRHAGFSAGDLINSAEFTAGSNETETTVTVPTTPLELVQTTFSIDSGEYASGEIQNIFLSRENPQGNADDTFDTLDPGGDDDINLHLVRIRYQSN